MEIVLQESGMRIEFRTDERNRVNLVDFSACRPERNKAVELCPDREDASWQFLGLQVTGESPTNWHGGNRHSSGSESDRLAYVRHEIRPAAGGSGPEGKELVLTVENGRGLEADYHMQLFAGIPVARVWSVVRNVSGQEIGLDYVTSFTYQGLGKNGDMPYFDKMEVWKGNNSWCSETQWEKYTAAGMGLSGLPVSGYNQPDKSHNRWQYQNLGSWSSGEHLPMGMLKDTETGEIYYYQVEHSGSWQIEYGSGIGRNLFLALMGPNEETFWWKNLKPGESFATVPAAFGVCLGGENEAIAALTRYRRAIRRRNRDDERCFVVFNDYMNCLFGDPTEEKEKKIIDIAAALGCEYYCMDAGWYDKGAWWDRVGEWKESPERFPNGMKAVFDYARSKGLKMGLWLEIEVMGTACELAGRLPDDWFVCVHGKRRVDNKRYLLDFRNPAVRQYCTDTVDRLVRDYGCEYFKIDYNVTTGAGSDVDCDSQGDALLEHVRCLYDWIREIYARHPELVIENCGSGAQRMDYGILSLHSLQSTSDQMDYVNNSHIAANVASAVTPEQAGMWVYPYEEDEEHIIYNVVNGLLLRPYISGMVWKLGERELSLLKEGIEVYKEIRGDVKEMVPWWPLGFSRVTDEVLAFGLLEAGNKDEVGSRDETASRDEAGNQDEVGNRDETASRDEAGNGEERVLRARYRGRVAAERKAYLSVFCPRARQAVIPLPCHQEQIRELRVIFPREERCEYRCEDGKLVVEMPVTPCARTFVIRYGG